MSYSADERIIKDRWNYIHKKGYKSEIDKSMSRVVELLNKYGVTKVLDLGCGSSSILKIVLRLTTKRYQRIAIFNGDLIANVQPQQKPLNIRI